jgi:hypothetical protein
MHIELKMKKLVGKRPNGRPALRWESVNMDLEVGYEDMLTGFIWLG